MAAWAREISPKAGHSGPPGALKNRADFSRAERAACKFLKTMKSSVSSRLKPANSGPSVAQQAGQGHCAEGYLAQQTVGVRGILGTRGTASRSQKAARGATPIFPTLADEDQHVRSKGAGPVHRNYSAALTGSPICSQGGAQQRDAVLRMEAPPTAAICRLSQEQ